MRLGNNHFKLTKCNGKYPADLCMCVLCALAVCMRRIAAGMNEDGSFIGQYGRKRRPPPGGQPDSASQAFATLV